MPLTEPARGEVYAADFDPVVGREQGGRRPVLVISMHVRVDLPHGGLGRIGYTSGATVDSVPKRAGLPIGLARSR